MFVYYFYILGESRADIGTIFGVFVAILIVGGIVAGVVYYMHGHGNLLHKSSSGVSFENPSYLREVNMENMVIISFTYEIIYFFIIAPVFFSVFCRLKHKELHYYFNRNDNFMITYYNVSNFVLLFF